MKNVKSDTKYIIKRILIGVGIAIVLFNLKKCNVYADTKNYYIWCRSTSANQVCMSNYEIVSGLTYLGETITTESDTYNFYTRDSYNYDFGNVIFKNEETGYTYVFTIIKDSNLDISNYKKISFGMPLTSSLSNTTMQFPTSAYVYGTNDTLLYNMDAITSFTDGLYPWSQRYRIYEIDNNDNVGLITQSNFTTLLRNNKLTYVGSNYNDIELSFGDTPFYTPITEPLANYTQLDLTGHQAVLLTPKNYQTMLSDSSHTIQPIPGTFNTYLDLDYYSQGCVQGSLIDINNTQDIITNNVGVGLGNLAETISGTCYEEPTQTILSYQFDMYSGFNSKGILIYNNSKNYNNSADWINNQQTPYGQSYVWYNPTLYNYYLIDNFDTFTADITYTDFSGEEKTTHVDSIPTFTDFMNSQKYQDTINDNPTTRQKITQLLNLIKLPFNFLYGIINGTCEPLQAPIPHTNSNIILPCLSSQFESFLGQAPYNFFRLIINGLLCYRIVISLIIFTERNLDPSDARIEVLDL